MLFRELLKLQILYIERVEHMLLLNNIFSKTRYCSNIKGQETSQILYTWINY